MGGKGETLKCAAAAAHFPSPPLPRRFRRRLLGYAHAAEGCGAVSSCGGAVSRVPALLLGYGGHGGCWGGEESGLEVSRSSTWWCTAMEPQHVERGGLVGPSCVRSATSERVMDGLAAARSSRKQLVLASERGWCLAKHMASHGAAHTRWLCRLFSKLEDGLRPLH
jgi:hypothetical protein